jgi:hypothetical protein
MGGDYQIQRGQETRKRRRSFLLKRNWFSDKYNTFKSCASVFLVVVAIAGSLLIIRLVGERRLQSFLNMLLSFKRKEPKLDLASKAFVSENKI